MQCIKLHMKLNSDSCIVQVSYLTSTNWNNQPAVYSIAGKFSEELNLAITKQTTKLNSANNIDAFTPYVTHASNRKI